MSSPGDGSGDDAELDDAHLHDLRAVLREMPDEEPPMRGMAELMAAARAQVAPASPSLWQRLAAFTRRPMVLALASVTLVAGGAVLIQRHHVAGDSADAVATVDTGAPAASTTIVLASGEARASAGSAAPAVIAIDGKPGGGAIAIETPRPEPVVVTASPPRRPPAAHAALADRRPNTVLAIPAAKPAATSPSASSPPADEADLAPSAGGGSPEAVARPAHVSAAAATPTAPPPPAPAKADAHSPVAQWLQQCERAAAASDCDAVRRLAARISEADPAFYRDHVVKDASLAHCLTTVLSE